MKFDIDLATELGVDSAILIENIAFWIRKNQANDKNFFDGYYWTYNSTKAFKELFPFWSENQIYRLLRKLESRKILKTGNYNRVKFDRTKWFTITDESILRKYKIHFAKTQDGFCQNEEPIPYINTYIKTYKVNGVTPSCDILSKKQSNESNKKVSRQYDLEKEFTRFWDMYQYKKGDKGKLMKKWEKLNESDKSAIFNTLPAYIESTPDKKYRKHPQTYLNNRGWDDEVDPENWDIKKAGGRSRGGMVY